jgi:hypothetical protein
MSYLKSKTLNQYSNQLAGNNRKFFELLVEAVAIDNVFLFWQRPKNFCIDL